MVTMTTVGAGLGAFFCKIGNVLRHKWPNYGKKTIALEQLVLLILQGRTA